MAIDMKLLEKRSSESAARHHKAVMEQDHGAINVGILNDDSVISIPLALVVDSPFQVKGQTNPEDLDTLRSSIVECGLVSPVVVRKMVKKVDLASEERKEVYELIAGHTRVAAMRSLGFDMIPAIVKQMTDVEAAKALTTDNLCHKYLTDYDQWLHVKMLESVKAVKTSSGMAEVLGCARSHLYRLRHFASLPEDALAVVDQNRSVFGATLVESIVLSGYIESCPATVTNAIALLASGKLKGQVDVLPWIKARSTGDVAKSRRRELVIQHPDRPDVKIVSTDKETRIRGEGIDPEKLHRLIAEHLNQLY